MGNVASYFSGKESLEEYVIGQTDEKIVDGSHHTPARCGKILAANQFCDPRSPTFDIDRTPIEVSISVLFQMLFQNVNAFCFSFKSKMKGQWTQDLHHLELYVHQ